MNAIENLSAVNILIDQKFDREIMIILEKLFLTMLKNLEMKI